MKSITRIACCLLLITLCAASAVVAQDAPQNYFDLQGTAGPLPNPYANYPGGAYTWSADTACTSGSCDYWNMLNGTGNTSSTGGVGANSQSGQSSVRTFVLGTASTNSFTGGGSKDPNDLSQWAYSSGPPPTRTP